MFGFSSTKRKAAAQSAFDAVSALCGPYARHLKLSEVATNDPYLAGFLSTRIANMCALAAGEHGLDHSESKEIGLEVLQKIYGDDLSSVLAYAKSLNASGDSQYLAGQECGRRFLQYVTNRADIRDDPDFSEAMEIAASIGLPRSSDMSVPLAGLDQIWFGRRMEKYQAPSTNRAFEKSPNAPDFARCEPARRYELGDYLCVLVKDPPAVSARIAPRAPSISFTFAMVVIGGDKNVKLIIAGEKSHSNEVLALMGMPASNDTRAFLCVTNEHGERENFGKHEGLDNENVFASAALAIAANRLELTDEIAYSLDGKDNITFTEDSGDDDPETDELEEEEEDPHFDQTASANTLFVDSSANLEEARADGDVYLAVKLQAQAYESQSSAIARTLEELGNSGTGNTQDDLLLAVEEARADGEVAYAAQLQSAIDSYRCHNLIESLQPVAEQELGKLGRLHRHIQRSNSQSDTLSAQSALEQAILIFGAFLSSSPPTQSLDPDEIRQYIHDLISQAENARAEGDTSSAYEVQCKLEDAFSWLTAAKLFNNRRRS